MTPAKRNANKIAAENTNAEEESVWTYFSAISHNRIRKLGLTKASVETWLNNRYKMTVLQVTWLEDKTRSPNCRAVANGLLLLSTDKQFVKALNVGVQYERGVEPARSPAEKAPLNANRQ